GVGQGMEECDDGNLNMLDGCSPQCTWEARLVFATSTMYTGNLGGLAGADAICNARAQAAGLPGTYMAWISASGQTPASRMLHSSVPYLPTDGNLVALDWADLVDGSLSFAIARTDFGGATPNATANCESSVRLVRTGTTSLGTQGPNICNNFTSANVNFLGTAGRTTSQTPTWSECAAVSCAT